MIAAAAENLPSTAPPASRRRADTPPQAPPVPAREELSGYRFANALPARKSLRTSRLRTRAHADVSIWGVPQPGVRTERRNASGKEPSLYSLTEVRGALGAPLTLRGECRATNSNWGMHRNEQLVDRTRRSPHAHPARPRRTIHQIDRPQYPRRSDAVLTTTGGILP